MTRRLLTALGFCAAVLAGVLGSPAIASANQSPTAAYCTPPNTIQSGQQIQAPPLMQNYSHAEQCGGQYGDLWSDGPLYSAAFSYFESSPNFTIPSMTWIAQGQRIYVSSISEAAPTNSTTYWWLETNSGTFDYTTTNSPPDQYAVLEYTITTDSNGITGVVNPALASEIINGSLSLSALPSGSCLQTGTGGVIQATGLPCGSGGSGIASVSGSGNISAATVSGAVTVSEVNSPTWTGTPTIAGGTTSGQLNIGSDGLGSIARTGTNGFQFSSPSNPTVSAAGGFLSGSSSYGATSAAVNGGLTATTLTASGLAVGDCVQTTTGGQLTTASGACATPGITGVNGSGNITASTVSGVTTVGIVSAPTFSGAVGASQFNGSGAGLTSGSVPDVALVTAPVTNVAVSTPIASTGGTTPTLSIVSSPGFSGTPTAAGFSATGALIAGSATAVVPSAGHNDLSASRSASTGELVLGGTSSSGTIDYGVSTASTLTLGTNTNVNGTLAATTLEGTGLTAGNCVQATTGGALTTTGSACGTATSVTSVGGTSPISASTVSGAVTVSCPTCVVGLTAGSNISVGTGTSPSVAVASSPTFSGQLAVDGNSAPSSGIALGTGTTPATFTSGVNASATDAYDFKATNCATNLVVMFHGASAKDTFGCNGSITANNSITSASSIVAGSGTAATVSPGDLAASRSSSTGLVSIGGSASACPVDYGITVGGYLTVNCLLQVNGFISSYGATSGIFANGAIIAGQTTAPTLFGTGDVVTSESNASGKIIFGGNSGTGNADGFLDFGDTTNHDFTFSSGQLNMQVQVAAGSFLASASGSAANGPTLSNGDGGFSRGASSGEIALGGSTSDDVIDYGVTASATETHSQKLAVPSITAGNLSSSASPVCGSSSTAIASCQPSVLFASSANASKTTGTTANAYQAWACGTGSVNCSSGALSFTTGTSYGANGEWLVHVEFYVTVGNTPSSTEYEYGCIKSTSSITVVNGSTDGASTCITTLANSIAGGNAFGGSTSTASGQGANSQIIAVDFLVPNSTAVTITPEVAGSTTTSATVYGYCTMKATWY